MGTQSIKVGLSEMTSGERFPSILVPTLVGFPKITKLTSASSSFTADQVFIGLEALKRSPLLSLKYPIEHGIRLDWDEAGMLLEHVVAQ